MKDIMQSSHDSSANVYDFTHMEENSLLTGVADNFLKAPHKVNYQLLWSPVSLIVNVISVDHRV